MTQRVNRHPKILRLLKERSNYMITNGITGTGRVHIRHHEYMRRWNKRVSNAQDVIRKMSWQRRIEENPQGQSFWGLYKEYKKKPNYLPEWFTMNGMAKGFHDLAWNYSPKNEPMPEWEPGDGQLLDFPPLNVTSTNFYENAMVMLKTLGGSKYCYSTDETTWDVMRLLDERSWHFYTTIYNEIFKTGCYDQHFREQKLTALKKKPKPICSASRRFFAAARLN